MQPKFREMKQIPTRDIRRIDGFQRTAETAENAQTEFTAESAQTE